MAPDYGILDWNHSKYFKIGSCIDCLANRPSSLQAVTAYSPVLLSQAGYSELIQNGLPGGLNTIGIVGTIISAQIVDQIGRRKCLMLGSVILFLVELVVST
jgi:MFS family permease